MTFTEWIDLLLRDYPYLQYSRVESHEVHQGSFYGKHALQIEFIVNTGLIMEYDSTRHKDGTPKDDKPNTKQSKQKERSKCGDTKKVKSEMARTVQE